MSQLSQALILVIQTLGSLYLLIVLLRFILQLVRADFYNPLSQFIVKATHPLLRPMRRVIPSMGSLDLSSLVLAIIVQMVLMALILVLYLVAPTAQQLAAMAANLRLRLAVRGRP